MKTNVQNPEAQNLINELDKNTALFFEACSAISTIADINDLFKKQRKKAPYSATPLGVLKYEAENERKRLQAKLESIQAACICKNNYDKSIFEWTSNGHNCDYYTCCICGREIKV